MTNTLPEYLAQLSELSPQEFFLYIRPSQDLARSDV